MAIKLDIFLCLCEELGIIFKLLRNGDTVRSRVESQFVLDAAIHRLFFERLSSSNITLYVDAGAGFMLGAGAGVVINRR
jgi:hypothetical protein